jgi:hypothetical protein
MIAPCLAEPQTVTTGPYTISFDLGIPKDSYSVKVSEPETKESLAGDTSTIYAVELINDTDLTRRAYIFLTEYPKDQLNLSSSFLVMFVENLAKQSGFSDVIAANRIIDGVNSGIASGKLERIIDEYVAFYQPNNHQDVLLVSFYPWEEETLQLLKTIHVTKTA